MESEDGINKGSILNDELEENKQTSFFVDLQQTSKKLKKMKVLKIIKNKQKK